MAAHAGMRLAKDGDEFVMTSQPLVSIVVPAYNEAEIVPRCIDSILAQTYGNLEILLVDDGSTDQTAAVMDLYARRDDRVKVIRQRNSGPGMARNAALQASRGEYIQYVDADDRIPPDMTEMLVGSIRLEDSDLAVCGFDLIGMDGERVVSTKTYDPPYTGNMSMAEYVKRYSALSDRMFMSLFFNIWNKLYRREVICAHSLSFAEGMKCNEDVLFTIEYLAWCRTVTVTDRVRYMYLEGAGGGQVTARNKYYPDGLRDTMRSRRKFIEAFTPLFSPEEIAVRKGIFADILIAMAVSLCRRDSSLSRRQIFERLAALYQSDSAMEWFSHYRPAPGQSQLIPWFLRHRLLWPLFILGRCKAERRFGKSMNPERLKHRRGLAWFS